MARTVASRVKSVDLGTGQGGTAQRALALSNGVILGYRPQDGLMGRTRTAAAELSSMNGDAPGPESAEAASVRQASLALETEPPSSQLNRRVSRQLSSTLGLPSAHELAKAHPHLSNLARPRKSQSGSRPHSQRKRPPQHHTNTMTPILSGIPIPSSSASASSQPEITPGSSQAASPQMQQASLPPQPRLSPSVAVDDGGDHTRDTQEGRRGVRFEAVTAEFDGPSSEHNAGLGTEPAGPATTGGPAVDDSAQMQSQSEAASGKQTVVPAASQQQTASMQQAPGLDQPPQHPLNQQVPALKQEQQPQQQPQNQLLSQQAPPSSQQLPQQLHQQPALDRQQQQQQQQQLSQPSHQQPEQLHQQLLQPDPIGTLRAGRISGDSPHPADAQPTARSPLHPPSVADPPLDSHPVTDPLSQHGLPIPHAVAAQNEPNPNHSAAATPSPSDPHGPHTAAKQSPTTPSGSILEPVAESAVPQPEKTVPGGAQEHQQLASEPGVRGELGVGDTAPGRRRPQRVPTPQVLQQLPAERGLVRVTPLATLAERSEDGTPSLTDAESLATGTAPDGSSPSATSREPSQRGPSAAHASPFQGHAPFTDPDSNQVPSTTTMHDPHEPRPIASPHIVQLPTPFAAAPLPVSTEGFDSEARHLTAPNGMPVGVMEDDRGLDVHTGTMPHLLRTLVPYQTSSGWRGAAGPQKGIIIVPTNFEPKEGTKLTEQLVIGKYVGGGKQGGIYSLHRPNGHPSNSVLKVMYKQSLASFAGMADVEREWEVGRRLNFLAEADGSLPGFMGVGAAIKTDKGVCRGMVLQRLHGRNVDKVLQPATFIDIDYIHDMLLSVFVALDKAQGALGFHHQDFRLENIMEMLPESSVPGTPQGSHASRRNSSRSVRSDSGGLSEDSFVDDIDPRQRFKIIDYGLGVFDENYAAGPDLIISEGPETMPALERQQSHAPAFGCMPSFPFPTLSSSQVQGLPKFSLIERMYRFYWRRKGDVYHLLFNLGEWLDGRVWLKKDRLDVQRLLDLIHHVTGARLQAYFVEANEAGLPRMGGCGFLKQNGRVLHFARRWSVRLQTWTRPNNPGLTAAEALTSNFFTKRTSCRMVVEKQRTFEKQR